MPFPVSAEFKVGLNVKQSSEKDLGRAEYSATIQAGHTYDALSAVSPQKTQSDLVYVDKLNLLSNTSTTIDLSAGTIKGPLQDTITFAEVTSIMIKAAWTNTTNITLFNNATFSFQGPVQAAGTITLVPGGIFAASDQNGWVVVDGTNDILKIANATGAAADVDIVIIGRSVAV